MPKNVQTTRTIALISHASKVILKILQARLQRYMNLELPDVQVGFGKLSSGHRTGKGQPSFQSQRKEMPKNVQTTAQLHSSHMLVK